MAEQIRIEGIEPLVKQLAADLEPVLEPVAMAVAAEAQDRISPYPKAPARRGRRWYERGYGPRYQRKDGTVGGRKTSETLGRRWAIRKRGAGAVLQNTASYGTIVHDAKRQAKVHQDSGWVTDEAAAREIEHDGTVERLATAAIVKALGATPR